jgi:hypothetical protein
VDVLTGKARLEHFQHLGLEIVCVHAPFCAHARGKSNREVTGSGPNIGDGQPTQTAERVECLVGFFFGHTLRSFEPRRSLPSHYPGKPPPGNRVNSWGGNDLREQGCRREEGRQERQFDRSHA